jgi:hypothetical protein
MLDLYDLKAYKYLLEPRIKLHYPNLLNCTIYQTHYTNQLCICGCKYEPIAQIEISLYNPIKPKKYGVLLFPTPHCIPAILNIDNRGYRIKTQMYDEICDWLKNIPRPFERQRQRTNLIQHELFIKTYRQHIFE